MYLYLSGGAGVGTSVVVKALFQALHKICVPLKAQILMILEFSYVLQQERLLIILMGDQT